MSVDLLTQELQLVEERIWRRDCRKSLVEYARTVPIPGVPLTDNYEKLLEEGEAPPDDGRYDTDVVIPTINTAPAAHHVLIYQVAQAVIEGTLVHEGEVCKRAMFMTPPGAAKSTCLNVVTASWAIGKYGHEVILVSCADMIAKKHGKRARQLCQSQEHTAIFGTGIDPTTKSADNWALLKPNDPQWQARYLSAGLHGAFMGQRCDGLIWDDVLKGRRAAESQTERDNAWTAYKDDARTRKKPTAWELGVGTRWHEDDNMGRILPEDWAGESGFIQGRDGYLWYVVCLQAQVETESDPLGRPMGSYLWEEWFNEAGNVEDYWRPLKLDTRSWSSLYQQVPTPPEGDTFKESWVQYYDHLPKQLNYFVTGDYAVTRQEDGARDYTQLGVWGVDSEGAVYFVEGWHGQTSSDVWIETVLDLVERNKAIAHVAGKGQIRRGTEPFMLTRMRKRRVFTELVWYEESYSKETNVQPFRAMMASGMVHWPRESEEAAWIIRHLIGFGTLAIDDPVDMCAMIGRHVASLWGPAKPKPLPSPVIVKPGVIRMADVMKPRNKALRR